MGAKNRRKSKRINLLEMSKSERIQLIRGVKEKIRQKIIEEKLWHSLLETEKLTINGKAIFQDQEQLVGLYLKDRLYG